MDEQDRQHLEELKRENQQLRAELNLARSGLPNIGLHIRFAWRVATAFGLGARLREWMKKVRTEWKIPDEETVRLANPDYSPAKRIV
jgi:hypothetical protein